MKIAIRTVRDDAEFESWHRGSEAMFGAPESDAELAVERALVPLDRTVAAVDGERIVGTAASYPFEMTLPGGGTIPVAGVTMVTVSSTHRRRGILREMMSFQLDDVVSRSEPIAVLNSSESSIYGRFGYGIAELYQEYRIDTQRAAFGRPVPERRVPMRLITKAEAHKELPSIYDRCRLSKPGMLTQPEAWWAGVLGERQTWKGGGSLYVVVADADEAAGTGPGYALYRIASDTPSGTWKLTVIDMQAADSVVEAQLLRFLLDVDLVGTVRFESRPLDCPLRWWMREPREARVVHVGDFLWVRVLDVVRALSARRYPVQDELVIDIEDPFGGHGSGRYLVSGGPDGASCEPTHRPVDLLMDIAELGGIYLGQTRPTSLASAQRMIEVTPGALARADAFFGWPVAPWCTTRF